MCCKNSDICVGEVFGLGARLGLDLLKIFELTVYTKNIFEHRE